MEGSARVRGRLGLGKTVQGFLSSILVCLIRVVNSNILSAELPQSKAWSDATHSIMPGLAVQKPDFANSFEGVERYSGISRICPELHPPHFNWCLCRRDCLAPRPETSLQTELGQPSHNSALHKPPLFPHSCAAGQRRKRGIDLQGHSNVTLSPAAAFQFGHEPPQTHVADIVTACEYRSRLSLLQGVACAFENLHTVATH